ncbi:hypothetical protein Pelo_15243 [Pelomyxa schiedti]|nr:hypothetical protein Pelo_15243 [Pelomyxa schiedti]
MLISNRYQPHYFFGVPVVIISTGLQDKLIGTQTICTGTTTTAAGREQLVRSGPGVAHLPAHIHNPKQSHGTARHRTTHLASQVPMSTDLFSVSFFYTTDALTARAQRAGECDGDDGWDIVLPAKRPSAFVSASGSAATTSTAAARAVDARASRGGSGALGGDGGEAEAEDGDEAEDEVASAGATVTPLNVATLNDNVSADVAVPWWAVLGAVCRLTKERGNGKQGGIVRVLNPHNLYSRVFHTSHFHRMGGCDVKRRSDCRKMLLALESQGFVASIKGTASFRVKESCQWTTLCDQVKMIMRDKRRERRQIGGRERKAANKLLPKKPPEPSVHQTHPNSATKFWDEVCQLPYSFRWNILTVEMMEGPPWGDTLRTFFRSQPSVTVYSVTPRSSDEVENLNGKCMDEQNMPAESIDVIIVVAHGQLLHASEISTKKQLAWLNRDGNGAADDDWDGSAPLRPIIKDENGEDFSYSAAELYASLTDQFPRAELVVFSSCLVLATDTRCSALQPFIDKQHRFMSFCNNCECDDAGAREKALLQLALSEFHKHVARHHKRKGWATSSKVWNWNDDHLLCLTGRGKSSPETSPSSTPSPSSPPCSTFSAPNPRWFRKRTTKRKSMVSESKKERLQAWKDDDYKADDTNSSEDEDEDEDENDEEEDNNSTSSGENENPPTDEHKENLNKFQPCQATQTLPSTGSTVTLTTTTITNTSTTTSTSITSSRTPTSSLYTTTQGTAVFNPPNPKRKRPSLTKPPPSLKCKDTQ